MPFNIPIFLTWLRIVAIPLLIAVHVPTNGFTAISRDLAATVLFCAAAILPPTGSTVIWHAAQSDFCVRAFLDPVADKLMVAAALIVLVQLGADAIIATIIIGREITISALREWMAQIGATASVAVSMLGKVKTTAQMMSIPMLLFYSPGCRP